MGTSSELSFSAGVGGSFGRVAVGEPDASAELSGVIVTIFALVVAVAEDLVVDMACSGACVDRLDIAPVA